MEIDFASPVSEYLACLPEWKAIQRRHTPVDDSAMVTTGSRKKRKTTTTTNMFSLQEEEWQSMEMFGTSLEELINSVPNIVGQGLYPVLSLSNHSCSPNASIEFLQENNVGTMLALRNICKGEEITITYCPNGLDTNFDPDRFRHFQPTTTWKYFDEMMEEDPDGMMVFNGGVDDMEDAEDVEDIKNVPEDVNVEENENEKEDLEEDLEEEGSRWEDRRDLLMAYGFVCTCSRCIAEQKVHS